MQAPLTALRAFEAVVRHGGFGRAAEALCVTQSAVSHQVRALEDWLGADLFDRAGNQSRLLPHGAALAVAVGRALAEIDAACVQARRSGGPPRLTVAVIPSIAVCWLIPRLSAFRARAPEVGLRIVYAMPGPLSDLREADVAIVYHHGPPQVPGMAAEPFLPGDSAPVASPSFAAGRRLDTAAAIVAAGVMHDTDGDGWAAWLAGEAPALAAPSGPVFEDFNLLRAAALAGQGVALCPLAVVGDDLAAGRLVQLSDRTVLGERAYHLLRRTGTGPDIAAALEGFCAWLRESRGPPCDGPPGG